MKRVHPNRRRGEILAVFDGEPRLLCLTLGALAELETAFEVSNLAELASRFEGGKLSAGDIIKILGAGLRGAGNLASDADVAQMSVENGVAGFATIATELLWVTFAGPEATRLAPKDQVQQQDTAPQGETGCEGAPSPHMPQVAR